MERVTEANRARAKQTSAKLPIQPIPPPPAPGPAPSSVVIAAPPPRAAKADGRYRRAESRPARDVGERARAERADQTRVPMSSAVAAEQDRLRSMPAAALVRQALAEVKLLAKAEVLHAKQEMKEELENAKVAGILLGLCFGSGMCGLSVLFVALALALPVPGSVAALLVGGVLVLTAAACGAIGYGRLPKKPLQRTQQRLKQDLALAREQLA